jgi:hypothetical protein
MDTTAKTSPVIFLKRRSALIGVALVLACALAIVLLSGDTLRYVDETDYQDMTQVLIHKHAFLTLHGYPTALRPPGYPLVIAPAYLIAERPLGAKLLNAMFLAATAYMLCLLTRRMFASSVDLAPYLTLCCPIFFYTASTLYPQTFGGMLLVATILLISRRPLTFSASIAAGLLYGVLCLAIPSFLLLIPILAAYVLVARTGTVKSSLFRSMILVAAIVVTIAPWTIRNKIELGKYIPVSTNGGMNLALGNSAQSSANGKPDIAEVCPQSANIRDEVLYNEILTRCALDWISHNPSAAAQLWLAKTANYFNFRNDLATSEETARWKGWLEFVTYYPLLALALVRLLFYRSYRFTALEALLYFVYFANAPLSAVFFTRVRFRVPFDLLLIAIDSAFLLWILAGRRRTLGSPSAAIKT